MSTMPLIEATEEMVAELHQSLAGEAKFDWLTRQIYSTDASMYRVIPAGVVFPKDGDDVAAAWDRVVPGHLRGRAAVLGCRSGVLSIRCRSASDRFALDRWLRGGGEQAVRDASRSTVKRVKLTLR